MSQTGSFVDPQRGLLKGGTPGVTRRSGQSAWRVAMCRTEFLCHTGRTQAAFRIARTRGPCLGGVSLG